MFNCLFLCLFVYLSILVECVLIGIYEGNSRNKAKRERKKVSGMFTNRNLLLCHQLENFSSYKLNKDMSPVVDMDWLASDLPVIAHANGSMQVMDMELKVSSSPLDQMDIDGTFGGKHKQ